MLGNFVLWRCWVRTRRKLTFDHTSMKCSMQTTDSYLDPCPSRERDRGGGGHPVRNKQNEIQSTNCHSITQIQLRSEHLHADGSSSHAIAMSSTEHLCRDVRGAAHFALATSLEPVAGPPPPVPDMNQTPSGSHHTNAREMQLPHTPFSAAPTLTEPPIET